MTTLYSVVLFLSHRISIGKAIISFNDINFDVNFTVSPQDADAFQSSL